MKHTVTDAPIPIVGQTLALVSVTVSVMMGALLAGCALVPAFNQGTIYRKYYHKWYPNAEVMYKSMSRQRALEVLQDVLADSIPTTRGPLTISETPSVTENGLQCVFRIIITHRQAIDADVYFDRMVTYYKVWDTTEPDEHNLMSWGDIYRIDVAPVRYVKYGDCWEIHIHGPWERESEYHGAEFYASVFTEEDRDKAIAALLMLCPNVK